MSADIISKILGSVKKAHDNTLSFEEIYVQDVPAGKNEFLMFLKPEITLNTPNLKTKEMLDLVLKKIEQFGLKIHNIKALGAPYLDQNNVMAQHYGVINKIANDAKGTLSESAKEKFKEFYATDIENVTVMGGFEFMKKCQEFTPYTLDVLWQAKQSKKHAGGTYLEDIKLDDEMIYLVNGFHPRQLHHFIQKSRSIIVFTLSGDASWQSVRDDFIGNTFPEKANSGSVRREFFDRKDEFGLPDVSVANNGIHLSAGPIEGLVELIRYNSNLSDKSKTKTAKDFSFGKKLHENFNASDVDKILSNVNVDANGKKVSVFDLTELMDSDQAITALKEHFKN